MNISPRIGVIIAAGAVFLLAPYVPYSILGLLVGNRVSVFLLLCLVVYILTLDNVLGLAAFLALAALFLEHRRRKVEKVTKQMAPSEKHASVEMLNVPAPNIVPGEVHPERKTADVEDYSFEPTEESGDNKFDHVGDSQDDKHPLDTVPPQPNEVSEMLQQRGLAHLN
jgi:hypothetical protein